MGNVRDRVQREGKEVVTGRDSVHLSEDRGYTSGLHMGRGRARGWLCRMGGALIRNKFYHQYRKNYL